MLKPVTSTGTVSRFNGVCYQLSAAVNTAIYVCTAWQTYNSAAFGASKLLIMELLPARLTASMGRLATIGPTLHLSPGPDSLDPPPCSVDVPTGLCVA